MNQPSKDSNQNSDDSQIALDKWVRSADAWMLDRGELGDRSRRTILDPALESIIGSVAGQSVLDLGCGEGRYSRVLKERGALVTGIDPVPEFIAEARKRDPESTYIECTAESLPLADSQFDVVLSYLSLIDIPDLESASREVRRVMKPQGQLVIVNLSNIASPTTGWVKSAGGRKLHRTVDRYMEHFSLDVAWRGISIRNYHRPLSYVLGLFLNHNYVLEGFEEPLPPPTDSDYADECRAPNFQIYVLRKQDEE